ncbi:hypothetical protein BCR34DRAFT_585853 [Clohesyomyces aquaticus]|uniref:Uncharacterized protein n=1 Tax=Clohesyomyces aquaticus TaxID=1231657 RepID=A0A1Y1ZXG7_9PLEO|nr:hypothetical protein BCR34DRAFT_585853 [Clohesyomyces aquaticus]
MSNGSDQIYKEPTHIYGQLPPRRTTHPVPRLGVKGTFFLIIGPGTAARGIDSTPVQNSEHSLAITTPEGLFLLRVIREPPHRHPHRRRTVSKMVRNMVLERQCLRLGGLRASRPQCETHTRGAFVPLNMLSSGCAPITTSIVTQEKKSAKTEGKS